MSLTAACIQKHLDKFESSSKAKQNVIQALTQEIEQDTQSISDIEDKVQQVLRERGDLGGRYEELETEVQEAGKQVVLATTKCEMQEKLVSEEMETRQGLVDNLNESQKSIDSSSAQLEAKETVF